MSKLKVTKTKLGGVPVRLVEWVGGQDGGIE